ncbi:MAG TPA: HEAT repeat domain-containing protein [Vicinamibacterales bacterium]|nr:HEAT repeat domain-containing protein [Vicinamibacterales bacterium]
MRAFAPLVMDADGADLARRYQARAAIIESAPAFLDSLIGRFAAESQGDWSAIEALGRLATGTSRMYLRALFRSGDVSRRQGIALALARVGHSDDAAFLADVLQDATVEERSRSYAALGLGRIGGDQSVGLLEGALSGAPAEIRSSIATALGNTRSRAAVPILISLSGNNPAHNDVCGALKTLTHRTWCDGSYGDPAAKQRRWQRWWTTNGSNATMFGPDNCPVPPEDVVPAPVVEPVTVAGMPLIASVHPAATAPNTIVSITGFFLGLEDTRLMRVLFVREHVEIVGAIDSTGRVISDAPDGGLQYMSVVVPKALTFGTWHVVIHAHGRTSVPVALEITAVPEVKLIRVLPERPHPAQLVSIATRAGAQVDDEVELTDARGTRWRLLAGVSSDDLLVALPDEIADGQATVRVVGTDHGVERLSAPLKFWVTSGPLPLKAFAVERMTPAAPGQWTDLAVDNEIEFEVGRADRIDVDFRQGNETFITQATEPDGVHVQVPVGLAPGVAWVRTRTWIEQTASEWSPRGRFRVLDRPK